MAKKTQKKIGRPSLYKPEYCEQLIEHQASGLSFESFAGVIGVNRDTVYHWLTLHKPFSDAKKIGDMKCLLCWEKIGKDGVLGLIEKFNPAVYCFNMKNRFKWRDRFELGVGDGRDFHGQLLDQIESAEKVIDVEATEKK